MAYHINEFGDKVYGYKKKKPTYQKPRVNNFVTNVTEGGHKQNNYKQNNYKQNNYKQNNYKQSNYKDTRNTGNKETRYNKNTERKDNNGKIKETKVKGHILCGVCSETTHSNLLGCPEF